MMSIESASINAKPVRTLKFADEHVSPEPQVSVLQPTIEVLTDVSSLTGTDGETKSKSSIKTSTPSQPLTPPTFPTLTFPGSDLKLKAAKTNGDLAVYFPISFALNGRSVECYFFAFSAQLGKSLGPATRFSGYPHAFGKGDSDFCTILAFSCDLVGQIVVNFTLDKLSTADVNKLKVYQDFWTNIIAHADLKIVDEITDYITDTTSFDRAVKHSGDILLMKAKAGAIWKVSNKSGKTDKALGSPTPPKDSRSKRNIPVKNYAPEKQSTRIVSESSAETCNVVVVKKKSVGRNKRQAHATKVVSESEQALVLKIKQLESQQKEAKVLADIQSRELKKHTCKASAKPDIDSDSSDDEAFSSPSLVFAKPRGVQSRSGKNGINPKVELAVPVVVSDDKVDSNYVKQLEQRLLAMERNSIISSNSSAALTVPPSTTSMEVVPHLPAAVGSNTNYTMQTSNFNGCVPGFSNPIGTSMSMQQVMGFNNIQTQFQFQQLQNRMQLQHLEDKMTLQQFGNQIAIQQQMNQIAMPSNPSPFNFRS